MAFTYLFDNYAWNSDPSRGATPIVKTHNLKDLKKEKEMVIIHNSCQSLEERPLPARGREYKKSL